MERAALSLGSTLGGRYRVDRLAFTTPAGDAWAGHDTVLDRGVLIFPLRFARTAEAASFAAQYATIQNPCISAIYDAAPGWLVCEHPPGGRLADRIVRSGLPQGDAARAMRDVCRALRALHDQGRAHGSVSEELVFFDIEGRAKLAGAGLQSGTLEDDLPAFAALARRTFAGRDALKRRGIPQSVASVLDRLTSPDAAVRPSLRDVEAALSPLVPATMLTKQPGFFRQEARWLVPVILLVGAAVAAVMVGVRIHVGPIDIGKKPAVPATKKIAVVAISDFDPKPGNGSEHPKEAPFAADGNNLTQWTTQGYKTPDVGGKKGVGLIFDLGSPQRVARIEVQTALPGWTAEWRTADSPGQTAADFTTVTPLTASGPKTTITLQSPKPARYWLLWITSLVRTDAEFPYQASVAEVSFFEE